MAETTAPVAAPAAPASTPSTAGQGQSAPETTSPVTGTPSRKAPSKYGSVPADKAAAIFASLDAAATAKTTTEEPAAGETPAPAKEEAKAPEKPAAQQTPAPDKPPAADAAAQTQKQPTDELPQSIREALKTIADPKLRKTLTDGQFILRDLSKAGVPYQTIRQFIQDAPAYLTLAPTKEVLESISQTAQFAQSLGEDFMGASPEGLNRFAGQLVDSSPSSFVAFTNHLLFNAPDVVRYLGDRYGQQTAVAFQRSLDGFFDRGMLNVVKAMKDQASKAPEGAPERVLDEVADELLKFLNLSLDRPAEKTPDVRDAELLRLRTEVEQARAQRFETFQSQIFNSAGNQLDSVITGIVNRTGFNSEAKNRLVKVIGEQLYRQLLTNPHINQLKGNIDRTGRGDQKHAEALVNLYVNAGNRLLPQIAQNAIRELNRIVRPTVSEREARVQSQVENRDVGASGPPAVTKVAPPPEPRRFKSEREAFKSILDAYDTRAENA